MARIYLIFIILAVFLALIFRDTQFLFDAKTLILYGKEISLNSQIIISGLATLIIFAFLLMGLLEKIFFLFKSNKKQEKKGEITTKE